MYPREYLKEILGTSLTVQGLRLCTSNAGGTVSTPGWQAKISHASQTKNQNIKQKLF